MKTSILNNMHLATFIDILSIQQNPETKKEYALILLNIYGNLTVVTVPQNIIPFIETLNPGDDIIVFIRKTNSNNYFLYSAEVLNESIYN